MDVILDNKIGNSFSPAAIFAGLVFVVVGVALLFENALIGIVLVLLGLLPKFTTNGVQIDRVNKLYKEYTSVYGIKKGKWKPLSRFPFLCVLGKTESNTAYSRGQVALTDTERHYDIVLLNQNHREKLPIKRFNNKDEAFADAKLLAIQLELKLSDYNPLISSRTRARR